MTNIKQSRTCYLFLSSHPHTHRYFDAASKAGQLVPHGLGQSGNCIFARAVGAHRHFDTRGVMARHTVKVDNVALDAVLAHRLDRLAGADRHREHVHVEDPADVLHVPVCESGHIIIKLVSYSINVW